MSNLNGKSTRNYSQKANIVKKKLSLFRTQATDFRSTKLHGNVIINQPFPLLIATFISFLFVVAIIIMLMFGSYFHRESVKGYVVPNKGLVKIYAPNKGLISKIHVKEGSRVKKGALLFNFSTLSENDRGGDLDASMVEQQQKKKKYLQNKITQERNIFESSSKELLHKLEGIKREYKEVKGIIELQRKQVKLMLKKKHKYEDLQTHNHISTEQLKEVEQKYIETKISLRFTQREQVKLENSILEIKKKIEQTPFVWESRLSDFSQNISDIEQNIIKFSGNREYSISASIDGSVTALQVIEGQSLNTQTLLMAIK